MILIYEDLIVNLFVKVDDFCKKAIPLWNDYLMSCNDVKDDNIKDNNDIAAMVTIMLMAMLMAITLKKEKSIGLEKILYQRVK